MARWTVFIDNHEHLTAQKPVIAAHFIWTHLKPRLKIVAVNLDTGREEVFYGRAKGLRMLWVAKRLAEPNDVEEL
jgi:hypothetical protein